jgi:hypothetical protein
MFNRRVVWVSAVTISLMLAMGIRLGSSAHQATDTDTLIGQASNDAVSAELRKAAMLELLKSKAPRGKDSVFEMALHPETSIVIRVQAIEAFEEAGSSEDSTSLSFLLQLHNPFVLRQAVASSLDKIGCLAGCVTNVLHYLERVWNGEHSLEDRFMKFPRVVEESRQDKRNLEVVLLDIMTHNKRDTRLILSNVYGLGSELPSPTAIRAVDKLGIKELCPDLRKAYTLTPPPDESIRKQLIDVLDGTCRGR